MDGAQQSLSSMPTLQSRAFPASHAMMIYPARRPRLEIVFEHMANAFWGMLRK